MIELIVLSRLFVDYFWEYKLFGILHVLVFCFFGITASLITNRHFKACRADGFVLIFLLLVFCVFALAPGNEAIIELLKFISFASFYFIGRVVLPVIKYQKLIGLSSFLALLSLSVFSLAGGGYIFWGNVATFTAGYYFKADLAMAVLIFLVFIFTIINNRLLLLIAVGCAFYLVLKSNSRISLPLVVILPSFIFVLLRTSGLRFGKSVIFVILISVFVGMSLFTLIDFKSLNLLGFDFSDPYSAANTQGRSVIWGALLNSYSSVDIWGKLFGQGLMADIEATQLFSESVSLDGLRAHSSYLYLLLCVGVVGSLIFYALLFSVTSHALYVLRYGNQKIRGIPLILCALLILFLWISLTVEAVIRPQIMILLFLFSGLTVQLSLKLKTQRKNQTAPFSDM